MDYPIFFLVVAVLMFVFFILTKIHRPRKIDRLAAKRGLSREISHHRKLYYEHQPEISDAEYDQLVENWRKL